MSTELALFGIASLPVILIGLFVYSKDRDRESNSILIKLFFLGIASCVPIAIAEMIVSLFFGEVKELGMLELFFYLLIGVGLIEELGRWIITYKVCWKHRDFDHIYDMIVYSVFVALGFAFLENLLYVYEHGFVTGVMRAILSVPGHASWGLIMGSYLGLAKLNDIYNRPQFAKKNKWLSLTVPIMLHTIYDFFLFLGTGFSFLLCIVQVILTYIYCIKKVKSVSQVTSTLYTRNCPNCYWQVEGNFCPRCGTCMNRNIKS